MGDRTIVPGPEVRTQPTHAPGLKAKPGRREESGTGVAVMEGKKGLKFRDLAEAASVSEQALGIQYHSPEATCPTEVSGKQWISTGRCWRLQALYAAGISGCNGAEPHILGVKKEGKREKRWGYFSTWGRFSLKSIVNLANGWVHVIWRWL